MKVVRVPHRLKATLCNNEKKPSFNHKLWLMFHCVTLSGSEQLICEDTVRYYGKLHSVAFSDSNNERKEKPYCECWGEAGPAVSLHCVQELQGLMVTRRYTIYVLVAELLHRASAGLCVSKLRLESEQKCVELIKRFLCPTAGSCGLLGVF